MTQQYYGQPGVDPYAPQGAQQYPPPGYQPAPNGYAPAPQGYGPPQQQYPAPNYYPQSQGQYPGQQQMQQPPAPVGAKGTVDEFFKQPTPGGGKPVSWTNKPDGYTYVGRINSTPGDGDLFQDSDPKTKQLKTWRDGSPKMVMPVPLDLVPLDQWQAAEYADWKGRVFLRGAMLKEFNRAMEEVGLAKNTVPQQGALVYVTITGRKPGTNMASNEYAVRYFPGGTWENDPNHAWIAEALAGRQTAQQHQAPQQAPYQQQAAPQGYTPAQAAPNPQQYAPAPYGAPAYAPNQAAQSYGGQPAAPTQPYDFQQAAANGQAAQYAPNPQQYQGQPPAAMQAPAGAANAGVQAAPYNPNQTTPAQPQLPGMPPQPPVPPANLPQAPLDPQKQNLLATLGVNQQQAAPNQQG